MVSDTAALQYILNSPYFGFGPNIHNLVELLHGEKSVMALKGDDHKRLRAALNVGFTAAAVRNYLPIFQKAAHTVVEQLENSSVELVDISPLLALATLGTITEAVLGHSTNDLKEELISSIAQTSALGSNQSASQILAYSITACLPRWVWRAAFTCLPKPSRRSGPQNALELNSGTKSFARNWKRQCRDRKSPRICTASFWM